MGDLLWLLITFAVGCGYGFWMRSLLGEQKPRRPKSWHTPERRIPPPDVVVVCIDADGLYCAKRTVLFDGEDGEWSECGLDGELTWFLRSRSPNRVPLWWQHLPGPKRGELLWRTSAE